MDEKNLALLAEYKKQISKQDDTLQLNHRKKVEPAESNIFIKPKAKVLAEDAPVSRPVPKMEQIKHPIKAKKKKKKSARNEMKNAPKVKQKPIKNINHPELHLIQNIKLVDKSKNRPVSTGVSISTDEKFIPKFDAKHRFTTPEWFQEGKALQHPSQQVDVSRPISIRIGIDFGTAFTKVAVKVGFETVIVDWSKLTGQTATSKCHLLPGIIAKTAGGEYCWQDFTSNSLLTNLKLPLLSETNHSQCPAASIAFLAFVIRYTRAEIYQRTELAPRLMQSKIRWELNIGCATEPFDKNFVVEHLRKVAMTAWFFAAADSVSEHAVEQVWQQQLGLSGLEAPPEVTPEFIAQIAGYLMSPQLKDDLHLLIDVGAATLDVASFNVVQEREQYSVTIPIFYSKVVNLGTHFLQFNRYQQLGLAPSWDDTLPVKDSLDFAKGEKLSASEVKAVDEAFIQSVVDTILQVVFVTKRSRKGVPDCPSWRVGLPVFLTGCGATNPLYVRALERVAETFKRSYPLLDRFRFIPYSTSLTSNSHISSIDARLSVAIGLTEDAAKIARIIQTNEIEDLERGEKTSPSHTEIYAK